MTLIAIAALFLPAGDPSTAESAFLVKLPPRRFAAELLPGSPLGIDTALRPGIETPAAVKAAFESGRTVLDVPLERGPRPSATAPRSATRPMARSLRSPRRSTSDRSCSGTARP